MKRREFLARQSNLFPELGSPVRGPRPGKVKMTRRHWRELTAWERQCMVRAVALAWAGVRES